MVVWTDNSIVHITEFLNIAREDTEDTAKTYMKKLIEIIYTVSDDNAVILAVLHTSLDLENALKKLKRDIKDV